jgi:hypothetical protein
MLNNTTAPVSKGPMFQLMPLPNLDAEYDAVAALLVGLELVDDPAALERSWAAKINLSFNETKNKVTYKPFQTA